MAHQDRRQQSHLRRGLRHVWSRAREIVGNEGWSALLFMVLGDLGYRRALLLERWLDGPPAPIDPEIAVTFTTLGPAEIDEYLRFHDEDPREQLEERFARGDQCFLARHEGRIVCASWVSHREHFMRPLSYRYRLGPTDAYLHDSYTAPEFRGRSVAPALGVHVLEQLRLGGTTRVTMAVSPENVANQRARAKTGFRVCGRIDCLRFGKRSWHRHREPNSRQEAP